MKSNFLDIYESIINNKPIFTLITEDNKVAQALRTALDNIGDTFPGILDGIDKGIFEAARNTVDNACITHSDLFDKYLTKTTATTSVNESVILSNQFKMMYDLITEDGTPGKYFVRVNDDHTWKLVDYNNPNKEFSAKDYKAIEGWYNKNDVKDTYIKYANNYSSKSNIFSKININDIISNAGFSDLYVNYQNGSVKLDNKDLIELVTNCNKNEFRTKFLKDISKTKTLSEDDKIKYATDYIKALGAFFLVAFKNSKTLEQRKAEAKDKQEKAQKAQYLEEAKANFSIENFTNAVQAFYSTSASIFVNFINANITDENNVKFKENIVLYNTSGKELFTWITVIDEKGYKLNNKSTDLSAKKSAISLSWIDKRIDSNGKPSLDNDNAWSKLEDDAWCYVNTEVKPPITHPQSIKYMINNGVEAPLKGVDKLNTAIDEFMNKSTDATTIKGIKYTYNNLYGISDKYKTQK